MTELNAYWFYIWQVKLEDQIPAVLRLGKAGTGDWR